MFVSCDHKFKVFVMSLFYLKLSKLIVGPIQRLVLMHLHCYNTDNCNSVVNVLLMGGYFADLVCQV